MATEELERLQSYLVGALIRPLGGRNATEARRQASQMEKAMYPLVFDLDHVRKLVPACQDATVDFTLRQGPVDDKVSLSLWKHSSRKSG
jgi:hypothetical protein